MSPTVETLIPAQPVEEPLPTDSSAPTSWWDGFRTRVATQLTPTSLAVLEADARFIVDRVVPRAEFLPDLAAWPPSRSRSGIVVGSVQSGKTASMLAVSALALDRGVALLVVLSGTRIPLWLQTYERLLFQLDGCTKESAHKRSSARTLMPPPAAVLGEVRVSPSDYLSMGRFRAQKAVSSGLPLVIVVPKLDEHLGQLEVFLQRNIFSHLDDRESPFEMVVLDDEADEASILDASSDNKRTPRQIHRLWSAPHSDGGTRHPRLYATYVAYTATPQANYLQATHNPLWPKNFQAALRTPGGSGAVIPRTTSYEEPDGIRRYYTGGEIFYRRLRGRTGDFCISYPPPTSQGACTGGRWQALGDALRAYFVAGAIRLHLSGKRLTKVPAGPVLATTMGAVLPKPHCMLFHPSSSVNSHFEGACDISRWSRSRPGGEDQAHPLRDASGAAVLDADGLTKRLALEEPEWRKWVDSYSATTDELRLLPGGDYPRIANLSWSTIRDLLETEVFRNVSLRVLNSDPRADERPVFSPSAVSSQGEVLAPSDIYSIFVAGNVLSRGLTIEGLSTSLFLRTADEPVADTQMQMQRWFGYRGEHLPFCRVFLHRDQLDLFRRYDENENVWKAEILRNMEADAPPYREGVLVLAGAGYRATAKVDARRVPLHPGPTPSIRLIEVEDPILSAGNTALLKTLLEERSWEPIGEDGTTYGVIARQPVGLLDVADILDGLRYTHHSPDPASELYLRWRSVQETLGIPTPLLRLPSTPITPLVVAGTQKR